jgi:MFS superfamily sulfate permease-like transporter
MNHKLLAHLKSDLLSGAVVFLVALPLCLGIALASGAPLFAGIIAGIVGGIVAGSVSGSSLGVSGPAAGLTIIVLTAIQSIGNYPSFLLAVVLAGVFQLLLSLIGAGKIAFYFPSSVIKGMLAAIGIIIILKQLPHATGYDKDPEGDFEFIQPDGQNTFSELFNVFQYINESALLIGIICLMVLILWEQKIIQKSKILSAIPASLLCVVLGLSINALFPASIQLGSEHLVQLPVSQSLDGFTAFFTMPNWTAINNPLVWQTAVVLAVVASLETLLCVEATDKLDPERRITPTNRELLAQGVGNIVSGLIGGIPVTQVVVRSSANINAGGKSKVATIFHGILLLVCAAFLPTLLNKIPLAALAAILIMVGYKLAKPSLFLAMYKEGQNQFVPFVVTIVAIVFTDLLKGIGIGLVVGLGYVLYTNFRSAISVLKDEKSTIIKFNKDIFFYNRANLVRALAAIKSGETVYIDASQADFIDYDIYMTIQDFEQNAKQNNIKLEENGISRRKINYRKKNENIPKTTIS